MQQLALAGHTFVVIALDGNPVPQPQHVEALQLGPGERVSALVEMRNPGIWIFGAWDDNDREVGRMGTIVEYAGKMGAPQWIRPPNPRWDYAIFGEHAPGRLGGFCRFCRALVSATYAPSLSLLFRFPPAPP
jgi:hypothetical protein